jgi:hypothetical protein
MIYGCMPKLSPEEKGKRKTPRKKTKTIDSVMPN